MASYERLSDATGNGALNPPYGSQPKARTTYVANWPDGIGRTAVTADYGQIKVSGTVLIGS